MPRIVMSLPKKEHEYTNEELVSLVKSYSWMQPAPAFQFYYNLWLGSHAMRTWKIEYTGAFINLLASAWGDPECSLPGDKRKLTRLAGISGRRDAVKITNDILEKCFCIGGRFYNRRLLLVRLESCLTREKHKKSAFLGVMARAKGKPNGQATTQPNGQPLSVSGSDEVFLRSDPEENTKISDPEFATFCKAYPKRDNISRAADVFRDALEKNVEFGVLMMAVGKYAEYCKKRWGGNTRYVANAFNWLVECQWETNWEDQERRIIRNNSNSDYSPPISSPIPRFIPAPPDTRTKEQIKKDVDDFNRMCQDLRDGKPIIMDTTK